MAYVASDPASYDGHVVGDGQCVAYVRTASGAPATSSWGRGSSVKGNALQAGTAIATFDANGKYGNHTDGTSHAAIYIGQDSVGVQVWDQWVGQPVHKRTIRFQGGASGVKPVNDGDAFYVVT